MSLEKPWEEGKELEREEPEEHEGQSYLLLEVANGILVSVGEEIEDVVFDVILLQVVHQVGSVALTI